MIHENKEGLEIDLQKLIIVCLRRWWLIALCAVIAAFGALYYTNNHMTPVYRASVTIYVNNARSDQQVNYITSANLATAQKLVSTYIEIIQSDTVLEKVAAEADNQYSPKTIRGIMSAKQKGETELFDVYIVHKDPRQAQKLANAIAEVAPDEIERFVEGSSAKIVDYAKLPEAPFAPRPFRNAVLGGLLGMLAVLAYIVCHFMMDVRIREEEDLAVLFAIPVLGQIPAFEQIGTKKHRKGKRYEYVADVSAEQGRKGGAK